ncbi:hypothetical protein GGTG_02205 [Gaeumannomyces tritici R3-111a-1]|uniref:Uncharacterized protein n=1 Tax=Gaeumannomyces tritici (strain R3-111a-1) TaxID=644352 RepID=J3NLQ5_GAET3|nr:hypothetical protein GGTG_02205 [Gaeumannomyces tritici R3-111a-1]EJT82231.1 hypothetical protein GGTG_02205 [Gaeumannomyces tritici R3-111a-1]
MRLHATAALLAGCAGLTAADSMTIWPLIYFNEGGRSMPKVLGLQILCMDWRNRRGHYDFSGQIKRCIRESSSIPVDGGTSSEWNEVACSWRLLEAGAVPGNGTSAAGAVVEDYAVNNTGTKPQVKARK